MTLANHKARPKLWREASAHWKQGGRTLNVACGSDYQAGWVNVDRKQPADVTHDLQAFPWPFQPGEFDSVLCDQYLEHVPPRIGPEDGFIATMAELARVLKPGGRLLAAVPHRSHRSHWDNHEHYRGYDWGSFDYPPEPWRLVWKGRSKRLVVGSFDSAYHGPRYLGFAPNVGPTEGLLFVLERV